MFKRAGSNKRLSISVLGLAMAVYVALGLVFIFILFPSCVLKLLVAPTYGLVTATLVANLIFLAAVVGFVLSFLGDLRLSDFGLYTRDVPIALVLTISVWIVLNTIEGAWQIAANGAVNWDGAWQRLGGTAAIGALVAQLFGNALYEEIFFRGVLLRQIYWRLGSETTHLQKFKKLAIALAISQSLFALIHLPILLSGGASLIAALAQLPAIFTAGAALAVLYARSDNLALCVGIHSLANEPTLLVADCFDIPNNLLFVTVTCLVLTMLWRRDKIR
jgi:membrane protease YdiL (CAAX protease family)